MIRNLQNKKFQKNLEDFICENCGTKVKGSGFTNHCPNCLWSKHVDINPGDRKNRCQGMMEPIAVGYEKQKYFIYHECQKCHMIKKNKITKNDNFEKLLEISKNSSINLKNIC